MSESGRTTKFSKRAINHQRLEWSLHLPEIRRPEEGRELTNAHLLITY